MLQTGKGQHKSYNVFPKNGVVNIHTLYNPGRITGRNLLFFWFSYWNQEDYLHHKFNWKSK